MATLRLSMVSPVIQTGAGPTDMSRMLPPRLSLRPCIRPPPVGSTMLGNRKPPPWPSGYPADRTGRHPDPPPFDYAQSIVYDISRIRFEIGFAELVDDMNAMAALVARALTLQISLFPAAAASGQVQAAHI